MKKAYKVTWISLASVVGVVLITVLVALYLVLSPKRLTSLVNRYASNFITCDYEIGKVDLTLFKTFPDVGLNINNVVLINPTKGWTTDTLARIDECIVSVNIKKLLFENEIIVNSCALNGGFINAFFDTEGNTNLDIMPPSETEETVEDTTEDSYLINLNKIKINNLRLDYTDLASNTIATINGLSLSLKGKITNDIILDDIKLNIKDLTAEINDTTSIKAGIRDISVDGKMVMRGDDITADATIGTGMLAFLMTGDDNIGADLKSLRFSYKGNIDNYENIKGTADIQIEGVTMAMDNEKYLDNANIDLNTPIELNVNEMQAKFDKSHLRLNDIHIEFIGETTIKDNISINMDVHTNTMIINDLIRLIPESMREEILSGIKVNGKLLLTSHIEGVYNDTQMPVINADMTLKDAYFEMPEELPYPLTAVNTSLRADLDLNGKSDVHITSLRARMNNTIIAASGSVKDVLDKMLCNLSVKADVDFDDVKTFLPEELIAQGSIKADVNIKGSVDQFSELDLMNTRFNGNIKCNNLNIKYADTINLNSSDLKINFALPNPDNYSLKNGLAHVMIQGSDLNADITNMMTTTLDKFNIEAQVSNILDTTADIAAITSFDFRTLDFTMDNMVLHSNEAIGSAFMLPSANEGNTSYALVYTSDSLVFDMGDDIYFATEAMALDINADHDLNEEDPLIQWNPAVDIDVSNAVFEMEGMTETVIIPEISLTYGEPGLHIQNSQVTLGNSDFKLDGRLTNLYEHFKNKDLLIGEFNFTSNFTDVNQLMDLFSGAGAEEETTAQNTAADSTAVTQENEPFMVPYGVDIKLHTLINSAIAGEMKIKNVGGDITIKDGILVLQEMGFTSDAAKMQLTALYKSKRKNHLYAGIDFHLLDIDISEMIRIIPDLDTIVPMLKSFDGKAEFHFAAETNLKSDYSLKYSTLKAACSIEGQDLVVLDGETFNKIKKLLLFSKKTDNKIDSLDVQFTVFKNEIDVYPFSVTMDKYSAMLYGRHNLDMSYDYNIAVLEPPILSRLGVEIKGPDFDHMKYKVRRSRHKNMFKPEKRDYKEEKIADIKKIIANSLKDNVKPQ